MKQTGQNSFRIWRYPVVVVAIAFVAVFGWRDEQHTRETFFRRQSVCEPYGMLFNPQRQTVGVVPLPAGWYTRETSVVPVGMFHFVRTLPSYWKTQHWQPDGPVPAVAHLDKVLQADMGITDHLIMETDRFQNRSDSVIYLLITRYNYGQLRWSCSLTTSSGDTKASIRLSKAQSDSVLTRWGLIH